jgi:hypothetical protein
MKPGLPLTGGITDEADNEASKEGGAGLPRAALLARLFSVD